MRKSSCFNTCLFLQAVASALPLGCGGGAPPDAEQPVADASVELTNVPAGVACVRIDATPASGPTQTTLFSLTAGASTASLALGRLPLGIASFSGSAYAVDCSDPSFDTAPVTWVSDEVSAELRIGVVTTVSLTFRPINPVNAGANFIGNIGGLHAGSATTFVRMADGTVRVAGFPAGTPTPGTLSGAVAVAEIAAGFGHYCTRRTNGTVWCAGDNSHGQLGNGTIGGFNPTLTQVVGVVDARQLALGPNHTCARLLNNTLCWGENSSGQLGDGTNTDRASPVGFAGGGDTVDYIATNASHTCAVVAGGVRCVGNNFAGQLGDGTTTSTLTPVFATGVVAATAVAVGGAHTCVVHADHTLGCWGSSQSGELGNGTTTGSLTEIPVSGMIDVEEVVTTVNATCVRHATGSVSCWGNGGQGTIGDGAGVNRLLPTTVPGVADIVSLKGGIGHLCAMEREFDILCWGQNDSGQLGDGTRTEAFFPIPFAMR